MGLEVRFMEFVTELNIKWRGSCFIHLEVFVSKFHNSVGLYDLKLGDTNHMDDLEGRPFAFEGIQGGLDYALVLRSGELINCSRGGKYEERNEYSWREVPS